MKTIRLIYIAFLTVILCQTSWAQNPKKGGADYLGPEWHKITEQFSLSDSPKIKTDGAISASENYNWETELKNDPQVYDSLDGKTVKLPMDIPGYRIVNSFYSQKENTVDRQPITSAFKHYKL